MVQLRGLTSEEANYRLQKYGPNTLREEKHHPFLSFLQKFWAPVPWMLEIIILLEIVLGKFAVAWVIGMLLVFNATLSFFEEGKARNAVRLLSKKLDVQTRCLRDGEWKLISAQQIVPDDLICIQMGDMIPADAKLMQGGISVDQSAITGESLPVAPAEGELIYAGAAVKHGEAYAQVSSTGKNTFFGQTAEMMRSTKTPSHLQKTIFSIVKYLVVFDVALIIAVMIYSFYQGIAPSELIPFALILLVASVPAALPATYALSTALGSIELAKTGVLVTRLSAIEEAAAMNILCADKTGTITQNVLSLSNMCSYFPYTQEDLLCLASLACEEATQDSFDVALLSAAKGSCSKYATAKRQRFIPFDPARKCSESIVEYEGQEWHILKGSPTTLIKMVENQRDLSQDIERLSSDGSRLLAVISGVGNRFNLIGLIALHDPVRETSKQAIQEIHDLGVKVVMMTGDGLQTARSIAHQVGLGAKAITAEEIPHLSQEEIEKSDVISGVFPEGKFRVIQLLQAKGHICGMTGDGVNDAPALKKAEVGIAMSNATDVAKAAASLVLTKPGLNDVVEAIKTSRRIYQRMLTYTANKIIKTLQISILLGIGLVLTNTFIISQLLIVLLLFANDFVTMSIATDRVSFSRKPDKWDIQKLMFLGGVFAVLILAYSFVILFAGMNYLHLTVAELRTWIFLMLVFTGQATVYLVRERKHFWNSLPSRWLIISSILDITIVIAMAAYGLLMAPLNLYLTLSLLASVVVYFVFLDFLKVRIFRFFDL